MSRIGLEVSPFVFSKSSLNFRFRTSFFDFSASMEAANFFSRSASWLFRGAHRLVHCSELAGHLRRLVIDDRLQLRIDLEPGIAAGAKNLEVHRTDCTAPHSTSETLKKGPRDLRP